MKPKYLIYPFFQILRVNAVLLLALVGGILLTACESEEAEHHEASTFLATSPLKKDTSITKEYVCQIKSVQHIELRALEKGYLQKIFVDEGDYVKKGQRMFQIMPMLYEAEKQKAQAEVSYAEIEYQNTKQLADSGIVSPNELALAKAKYDKAKAELALTQVHLDFTMVSAPFDGIMDRLEVRLGSLVDEGELLTTLSDNSEMWVYFNVPEAEYLDYQSEHAEKRNTQVRLLMANQKFYAHPGKVTTIEADFNNETGNIAFRATFPNPEGLLRYGETGTIHMPTEIKDALLIPQKATYEILDKKYVFVIDEANVIHSRRIEVEAELTHLYILREGLEEGDKILLDGLRKVKDGDKVKVDFVQPESALAELDLYAE